MTPELTAVHRVRRANQRGLARKACAAGLVRSATSLGSRFAQTRGRTASGSNATGWGTYSPDGLHVISVFGSGVGIGWDVDPADSERAACAVANRELTPAEWHDFVPERSYRRICS